MAREHEYTLLNMRDRSRRALSVTAMAAAEAASQTAPAPAADAAQKAVRRVTYTSYEVNTWQATFEQSGASPQHASMIWFSLYKACSMPPCSRGGPFTGSSQRLKLPARWLDFAAGVTVLVDPWLVGDLTFAKQSWLYSGRKVRTRDVDAPAVARGSDVMLITQVPTARVQGQRAWGA